MNAQAALEYIRNGGVMQVRTALRVITLDAKVLARFDRAGAWLLRDDGNGLRLRTGNTSVYLFPGQLQVTE